MASGHADVLTKLKGKTSLNKAAACNINELLVYL